MSQHPHKRLDGEPGVPTPLDAEHVGHLYVALNAAGLGGFKIAKLHLEPLAAGITANDCHAVKQADGTWHIVCN